MGFSLAGLTVRFLIDRESPMEYWSLDSTNHELRRAYEQQPKVLSLIAFIFTLKINCYYDVFFFSPSMMIEKLLF